MQIRCPVCDHSREVDLAKIPPRAEYATCPKCRHRFKFRALDLDGLEETASPPEPDPQHADVWDAVDSLHDRWQGKTAANSEEDGEEHEEEETASTYRPHPGQAARDVAIPWENPRHLGFPQSFVRTTLWAFFQPSSFFATLSKRPALLPAMLYYTIIGALQHVLNAVWMYALVSMDTFRESAVDPQGEAFVKFIEMYVASAFDFATILMVPFVLVIQLFITAGIIHLFIRLSEPRSADFALSFKVAAYAAAGLFTIVIPVAGIILSTVWYYVLLVIGCRSAFRLSWTKTMMAMSPLFVLIFVASSLQFSRFVGM